MTLTLHGIVRAGHRWPPELAVPRLVTWEDLAVIVSEQPVGRPLNDQDALAHLEMLCSVVTSGPVLPLRFGTTGLDEEAVRVDVLARTAPALREQLDRFDGLVEAHVYLSFDEETVLRAVHAEHDDHARFTAGLDLGRQVELGEVIARRMVAWRRARADALLAPVSAVAKEETYLAEAEHTEERRAFLVGAADFASVRTLVAQLPAEAGARCTGPLPVYSFLDAVSARGDETPAASRWGW